MQIRHLLVHLFSICILILIGLFSASGITYAYGLDTSFGTGGKVITSFGATAIANKSALQSDGKIVVVGSAETTDRNWVVARYNTDGSLDTSFGTGGKIVTDFGELDQATDVKIQSDGKIVVSGGSLTTENSDTRMIVRYNTDGTPDTTFGDDGVEIDTNMPTNNCYTPDSEIQSDGKIVAIGYCADDSDDNGKIVISRYNSDGSVDSGFGTGGFIEPVIPSASNTAAEHGVIQSDGKIIIAGDYDRGDGTVNVFLARFNTDGNLDTSFGSSGFATERIGTGNIDFITGQSLIQDSNGDFVVTGNEKDSDNTFHTFITRFNNDGSLDTSFGSSGSTIEKFSSTGNDFANAIALESDGKYIVAGSVDTGSPTGTNFIISRFNTDGTLDTSFANSGSFVTPVGTGGDDEANTLAIQSDGKVIAAGPASNGSYTDWGLIRTTSATVAGPTTLTPTADTYLNELAQNNNEGGSPVLRIQNQGSYRTLVKFDESQIAAAVGSDPSYTATLQFTITDNGNNWGTSGGQIEADRLIKDWTEGNGYINWNPSPNRGSGSGATWNCAIDPNISDNTKNNCTGTAAWDMDNSANWPFSSPTATATITNHETGTVSFDVTSDIQSFLNSTNQNYGWLIKKSTEGVAGKIDFGSKKAVAVQN